MHGCCADLRLVAVQLLAGRRQLLVREPLRTLTSSMHVQPGPRAQTIIVRSSLHVADVGRRERARAGRAPDVAHTAAAAGAALRARRAGAGTATIVATVAFT